MRFNDKTYVVCIGAQKCGTTWLHRYLRSRDEIFLPAMKELHYFDAKYRPDLFAELDARFLRRRERFEHSALTNSKFARALDGRVRMGQDDREYRNFFEQMVPEDVDIFGEITPAYALLPEEGFRAIRDLFKNIKVIFIMRDPVQRCLSQARMHHKKMRRERLDADTFLVQELSQGLSLRLRSQYEQTIARVESVFGRDEILYLFFERLFRTETMHELCSFLGMPPQDARYDNPASHTPKTITFSPDAILRVREELEPTYRFCRAHFGATLPPEWDNVAPAGTKPRDLTAPRDSETGRSPAHSACE